MKNDRSLKAARSRRRLWKSDVDTDVDDELRFHLDARVAEYEQSGVSHDEAVRLAHQRLGDIGAVAVAIKAHDRTRAAKRLREEAFQMIRQDFRFALRTFRRSPAFFASATGILGLGIGMAVAIFAVFRDVLIEKLPVRDQDRIVVMWTYGDDPAADRTTGTKELSVVRRESQAMQDVAAIAHWPSTPSPLGFADRTITLNRGMVTGNFFDVIGARPALGRLLKPSDDELPTSSPSAAPRGGGLVLAYRAWREKFGEDSAVIGRHLTEPLLGTDYQIVGVGPEGLDYPRGVEYWIPMWSGWQSNVPAFAVGRLRPDVSLQTARDEYLAIERRLATTLTFHGAHAATFAQTVIGDVRPVLTLLSAAVGLLLSIACINVGTLLLLRTSSRSHELSVSTCTRRVDLADCSASVR